MAQGHPAGKLQHLDSNARLLGCSLSFTVLTGPLRIVAPIRPVTGPDGGVQSSTVFSLSF